MPAVVEPDTDDLFRIRDAWPESSLLGRNEVALRGRARAPFVDEALESVDVALSLEYGIDAGRGAFVEILLGGDHVEDPPVGA